MFVELVLESLNPHTSPRVSDNIPQLDGPIDDENARTSAEDPDMTVERREFVICEYRQGRGARRSTSVTPNKRKRVSSCEDDDSCGSEKTKTKDLLPKTPRRSPSKRMSKLTSPSCPNRTYSPLSLEISSGQKTPKNSPLKSPTTRPFDGRKIREAFRRKRIFSPVKESKLGTIIFISLLLFI